jgi:replicative DNA helicase
MSRNRAVACDLDAERSLLATLCAPGNDAVAAELVPQLCEHDFLGLDHQALFRALRALVMDPHPPEINSLTLKAQLQTQKELHKVRDYTGLTQILLAEEVSRPEALVKRLGELRRWRCMVAIGEHLADRAAAQDGTPEGLLDSTTAELTNLIQGSGRKGLRLLGDVGRQAMAQLRDVAEGRRAPGIPTGLPRLDRMLGGGLKPGQLIILAARPGVGKSALVLQLLKHMAEHGSTVALWSLEMGEVEVYNRAALADSKVDGNRYRMGTLLPQEWDRLEETAQELQALPLLINDQATITASEIRAQADRAAAQCGELHVGAVDYLQLVSSPQDGRKGQTEAVRVGEISRAFKLLAKDRGIPLIVLSQLNREVESRGANARPQLSDLRDSGAIEQDADIVLFLSRKLMPGADGELDPGAELIVAKQRNGPTGVIPMHFDGSRYRFVEVERTTAPAPARVQRQGVLL